MQWRRRRCCAHTAKLLYLLSLLGLLVFLVHQVWLPKLVGSTTWRSIPPVAFAKHGWNQSSQHSLWRFLLSPRLTVNADANVSLPEKTTVLTLGASFTSGIVEEPQRRDKNGPLQPGPFPYIINEPHICEESEPAPFLVLLITTEARQVEARNAIRQTWGNSTVAPGLSLVRLFLLGSMEGELGLLQQDMLWGESRRHHDIIQQDFLDSYKNLTLKTLMGLNWVAMHCRGAAYVMKTDSDMFVNTEYLIFKLLRPDAEPRRNYFTGNNMRGFAPNRNRKSKWYMPPELYPGDKYPTFCSGTGYVFSGDLAEKIYKASLIVPRLHLEDVYVGVCLAKLGIELTPPPNGFLFNSWRVSYSSFKYSHLITSHGFTPNEILKYWHHLQSNKQSPCVDALKNRTRTVH